MKKEFKFKHTIDGVETTTRYDLHHNDFHSLVCQAWAEFCEDNGWSSDIRDGYTVNFEAFAVSGEKAYHESFGE